MITNHDLQLTLEKLAAIFAPIFLRSSAEAPKASISQETFVRRTL